MSIRSIDKNATIAWSPLRGANGSLLAAGTIAGSFDIDFNVHNRLEIIDTGAFNGSEMKVKAEIETAAGFTALAWSAASRPMGVIAGATTEGNVVLYDPAHFDKPDEAVIATVVKHSAAATCLDFCPSQQNLLVSGGADGELIVCDMNDPSKKTVHSLDAASESMATAVPGLGASGNGTAHPISSVAWNRKVGPILTAISNSGLITIWDLRKKSAILSFTDNGRRAKWRSASWDPSEPTLLVTAADEDENPVVLWDLRSIQLPRHFNGHKRGVWCTSWNQDDSSLLVTSGKDRTLCWNPSTMEVRCEIHTTAPQPSAVQSNAANPFGGIGESQEHWNSSALWSPSIPGTLALCSYGSNKPKISLVPLSDPSPAANPAPIAMREKQPASLQPVPAWMKRPVGCAFGFGGKIALFRNGSKNIELHKCDVDTELVERAERFRGATTSGGLDDFCKKKAAEAKTDEEKDLWKMFSMHYGPNIRTDLLSFLGYDKQKINEELDAALKKEEEKKDESATPAAAASEQTESKEEEPKEEKKEEEPTTDYFGDAAQASVFDNIADQKPAEAEKKEPKKEEEQIELTATGDDAVITQALLVGEYEKAARFCLCVGRDADALVIASYGGRELFETIRDLYCKRAWMPAGMKFVLMLLSNTLKSLVDRIAVAHWKAAMAALCTYASKEEFPVLVCQLGDRLRDAQNLSAATLCYIAASNMSRVVSIWVSQQAASPAPARESLPDLVEKLIVLKHAAKASDDAFPEEALDRFIAYAELLSAQGAMLLAASYVSFLSGPRYVNTPAAMFLDRLRRSGDAPVSSPSVATSGPSMPQQTLAAKPAIASPAKTASPFVPKPATPVTAPAPASNLFRQQPVAQPPLQPKVMSPMQTPASRPVPASTTQFMPKPPTAAVPAANMFRPQMPSAQPMFVQAAPVAVPGMTSSAAPVPATNTPPRPQMMSPMSASSPARPMPMQTFAPAPTVALSSARPKPERITTPLAAELQHVQLADSELAGSINSLVESLINALEQRSAGTPDEPHVRGTAEKLDELLQKTTTLPSDCANTLLQFLKDVEGKDSSSAQMNLSLLTKNHSKILSSNILTGLRFLQRLSAKLL